MPREHVEHCRGVEGIGAVIDGEPDFTALGCDGVRDGAEPARIREEGWRESGEVPGSAREQACAEVAGCQKDRERQRESNKLGLRK